MSLILDALRKMEQERKARRGATENIRPDVLGHRGAQRSDSRKRWLFAACAAVILLAGLAAGLLLKGGNDATRTAAGQRRAAGRPAPLTAGYQDEGTESAPAPAPMPQPPVPQPQLQPAPAVEAPRPVPAPPAAAVPRPVPAAPRPDEEEEERAPAVRAPSAPAPVAVAQPSDLSVTGIAWQDERRLRRAVVNGTLVAEGNVVAGARIVSIGERKVRFSKDGRTFDVPLSGGH
ncbi:hypothetical protein [Geobacter sulfurreducens]|uniref:hypothetical protein n=1 Tax=Geobacter sulfurreducens TaxID=35554 RepID=UPI000DBB0645|nr:hypothetical protein [Geobacter sulfurreducens]BBA70032.1 hypothetical protein YM18_1497 [Geobacter sulfurreducens]